MKLHLKPIIKFIIVCIIIFAIIIIGSFVYYNDSLKPVDKGNNEPIEFVVNDGDAGITIINNLKSKNLIKSELTGKIYLKLHPLKAQAGTYELTKSMTIDQIFKTLEKGIPNVWITFVEGKRIDYFAEEISKKFDYSKDEVMQKLDDKTYVTKLINKYDFLTDEVLKEGIYHPLEGYLFADTYSFDAHEKLESIIETMLDNTKDKLSKIDFSKTTYSKHQILTLASIVELEGSQSSDRNGIAGVFYNRINQNMSLGSDVTTYYGAKKDFSQDLTVSELNSCNPYNTRGTCVKGLPIGPIASPSIKSIEAAVNPTMSDNLFFVADKNGKTYFSKTNGEHEKIVNELKSQGLWYVYN